MSILDLGWSDADDAVAAQFESRTNIANAILRARLDKGLTQAQVGKAAGSKQSRISEIEALEGNPRLDTLERIASVLDMAVSFVAKAVPTQKTVQFSGYSIVSTCLERVPAGPSNRTVTVDTQRVLAER